MRNFPEIERRFFCEGRNYNLGFVQPRKQIIRVSASPNQDFICGIISSKSSLVEQPLHYTTTAFKQAADNKHDSLNKVTALLNRLKIVGYGQPKIQKLLKIMNYSP